MCVPVLPHYIEITIAVHIRHGTGIDTFAGDDWLGTLKYPLIIKVDTDLLCVPGYGGKYIQISVSVKIGQFQAVAFIEIFPDHVSFP